MVLYFLWFNRFDDIDQTDRTDIHYFVICLNAESIAEIRERILSGCVSRRLC